MIKGLEFFTFSFLFFTFYSVNPGTCSFSEANFSLP